jgi:hypothetical protein
MHNRLLDMLFLLRWLRVGTALASGVLLIPARASTNVFFCPEISTNPVQPPEIVASSLSIAGDRSVSFEIAGTLQRTFAVQRKVDGGPWDSVGMLPRGRERLVFTHSSEGTGMALYRLHDRSPTALLMQEFGCMEDTATGAIPPPPIGEPWILRGIGWSPNPITRIRNGFVVDENPNRQITYLGQRFRQTPTRIEMVGQWYPNQADAQSESFFAIALCAATETRPWYGHCLHIRFHRRGVAIDTVLDGPLVNHDLGGFEMNVGTPYHFVIEFESTAVTIWIDGNKILRSVNTDYAKAAGPYVFWEIYSNTGPMKNSIAIRSVAAFAP